MREGCWKYLAIDDNEYLFDLDVDERERANRARHEPGRLQSMRDRFEQWDATFDAIPLEAKVELVYTEQDMPSR